MNNNLSSGQANAVIMAQRPTNDQQIMAGGQGAGARGIPLMMSNRNSPSSGNPQQQSFNSNQLLFNQQQQPQQQQNHGPCGPMMQQSHQSQPPPHMQLSVGLNNHNQMGPTSVTNNSQSNLHASQRNFQKQQQQPQPQVSQQADNHRIHLEPQHQMQQSPISPRMDTSNGNHGMMANRNGQSSNQGPLTITTKSSPTIISPRNGDIQRMLHLYMHDYCLKNNLIKAANAIANETGVRTDEGVPFGRQHDHGLLLEWFITFWQNYVKAQEDQSGQHMGPSQDLFSQFDRSQPMAEAFPGQSHVGQSSEMRRTETEPVLRNTASQMNHDGPLGGGSLTPSPFGTGAAAAARFWGSSELSEDSVMQQLTPRSLGRETAASMQRLGWEGRPIESLSAEEKSKLANAVRQSQIHQQNALMQLTNSLQPSPITLSKIGKDDTSFSSSISTQAVPPSPTTSKGHSGGVPAFNNTKKSPGQSAARKKRRSSVNLQALSQIQAGNSTSPVTSRKNSQVPPPPASPAEAARTFEEHQNLAKQLQSQSQSIIGQHGLRSPISQRSNLSKAQQARSEAQSHATSQISAQIQQLQQQLMRDSNTGDNQQTNQPSGGETMQKSASNSSNQISQLRVLQGRLSQNNRDQEDQVAQSQNANGKGMHRPGSVQGPIVASQMPPASPVTSMGPPMSAPATPINLSSQQRNPAIANSPSSQYFGGMGMPANWQGNGIPVHFTPPQDQMSNLGNNNTSNSNSNNNNNNNMPPPQQGSANFMNGLGLGFGGQPGSTPIQQQQQQNPEQSSMISFDPQQHSQNQIGLSPFTAQGQNQNPMAFLQSPNQGQQQGERMNMQQQMGSNPSGPLMMDPSIWASIGMENNGMNESF